MAEGSGFRSLEEALLLWEKEKEDQEQRLKSSIRASCDVVKGAASYIYSMAQPHCQQSTRELFDNEEFISRASKVQMWDLDS